LNTADSYRLNAVYAQGLASKIEVARRRASRFFEALRVSNGYKYTITHDLEQFPDALLYGTWSAILGTVLAQGSRAFDCGTKQWALGVLTSYRRKDGTFLPNSLRDTANSKPIEYLVLHCTNYSIGAALELDSSFDFKSRYMDRFLDADTLLAWLDGRSFSRPWEEGNNIVNVASYLALLHAHGEKRAFDRLYQLLEWHKRFQNPLTGGFDCFRSPGFQRRMESLAGAVHNFHLHHYLDTPFGSEAAIADSLAPYLLMGPLTACLSLDFVELAIRMLSYSTNPQLLAWALLEHAEALLAYQMPDGGWLEADDGQTPTRAAGFVDSAASSCSYATWFRLTSLAMISIVLLGDQPGRWGFRRSLGMGYAPARWPKVPESITIARLPWNQAVRERFRGLGFKFKKKAISVAARFI